VLLAVLVGAAAEAPLTGCSSCNTSIATQMLRPASVGLYYSFGFRSDCGGDVWFLDQGLLPPGIGLLDTGQLLGTPTLAGTYPFTVGVFDYASGDTAYKGFALTVYPAAPTPTPTPLPG